MNPSEVLRLAMILATDEGFSDVEAILLAAQDDGEARDAALNALDVARSSTWRRAIALAEAEE